MKCRFKDCNNEAGKHNLKDWQEFCKTCLPKVKMIWDI